MVGKRQLLRPANSSSSQYWTASAWNMVSGSCNVQHSPVESHHEVSQPSLSSQDWFVALQTLLFEHSVATVQVPGTLAPSQADDAPEQ